MRFQGAISRVLAVVFWIVASREAMAQEHIVVHGNDTLRYRYTPIEQAQQPTRKPGFLRRVVNYFERSAEDHTFEKKIDFTFAGGFAYSKNTNVSLGLLGAGRYRLDRTDSITPPSHFTLFGTGSVVGFYSVGVMGRNVWRRDIQRLSYEVDFRSEPRDFWGIGYTAGEQNPKQDFVEKLFRVKTDWQHRLWGHLYAGVAFDFQFARGKDFDDLTYIAGQELTYTTTGLGLVLEYDSRDNTTASTRGLYLSGRQMIYAKGLCSTPNTFWKTQLTADFYQRVWRGGIVAVDLAGDFSSAGTPWPMLVRLGGLNRMRGYYSGRYVDRNLLTAQIELRQHLWRRIGCAAWVGGGNIFRNFDEFSWRHTLPNYGFGLRWMFKQGMNIRADYGFGKHTGGFLLSINEAF